MTVSSKEREARKVKILVDRNVVDTSFEKWAKPGHFSRTLAKGPKTTTWIWNLHADAHDFDSQTNSLEDISRKIFSAHFGQLAIIFFWVSGMHFHGALARGSDGDSRSHIRRSVCEDRGSAKAYVVSRFNS